MRGPPLPKGQSLKLAEKFARAVRRGKRTTPEALAAAKGSDGARMLIERKNGKATVALG